ncbi:sensor histidine kinase [Cohnella phaseoli]|uniref:Two-component system sensor histidine kinase YesM n=1 Tax=Cohnella phaseoli TaxID=456490 RepID=A0A3D9HUP3_9BACL|nr:histidine kinase [Cohnella phaseoli]RED53208.1 two-component system sensor histidine kinase YesM [Cohnella phaseoli]
MRLLRGRSLSIYAKLLISFLFVIVPLYVIALISNHDGSVKVREELQRSLVSKVHFYLSSFDNEMIRIVNLRNEYVFDKDLQDISLLTSIMSEYQYIQSVSRIIDRLNVLKSSSLYVRDVEVSVPSLNRTISTKSYSDVIEPLETPSTGNESGGLDASILHADDQFFIAGSYPMSLVPGVSPLYSVKITLSQELIVRSLADINHSLKGGAILFGSDWSWDIHSEREEPFLPQVLPYAQAMTAAGENEASTMMKLGGINHFVFYERSPKLNTVLLVFVPENEIMGPLKKNKVWLWMLSVVSVTISVLFSFWIHRTIRRPIRIMVQALRNVESGKTGIMIHYRFKDEFGYMYNQFNAMTKRLDVLIHEVYEQQIRAQRAELKQLQSQVNPHFLYNSYFVLYRIARLHDIDNVIRLAQHLGEYFRYITRSANDEVPFVEEWKHTLAYIEIQAIRYRKRMQTQYDEVPDACCAIKVPRLLLQPVMENAYEHGLANKKSGGLVTVHFLHSEQKLTIVIEDNGEDLPDEQIRVIQRKLQQFDDWMETTGLLNVHKRIQLKFGSKHGLQVSRASIGGLRVEMTLPVQSGG